MARKLNIALVSPEAVPYAKTGGLADVAGALPNALAKLNHDVTLFLPAYKSMGNVGSPVDRFEMTAGNGAALGFTALEARTGPRTRAILLACPELYDRDGLYGVGNTDYDDNARRFGMLARGTLEFCARTGFRPDVVHAHDWQAGLVPALLRAAGRSHPVLRDVPGVFTIHNLAYQGLFPLEQWRETGLPPEAFTPDGLEYWGKISFLKGGINFAECITTVSRKYAEEIQTPEFGFGFDGILRRRRPDLIGILNGVDYAEWSPEADRFIVSRYARSSLAGKARCKGDVLAAYGLPVDARRPLIGSISRLVAQKGFDLVAEVGERLAALDVAMVVLGTGDPAVEAALRDLASRHPDRVGVRIAYDNALAHKIEAGADMFLMPSRFEPCGLNQIYSLRYGTIPIVRATGGLDDTIENFSLRLGRGTGFKFKEPSGAALLETVKKALLIYSRRRIWKKLMLAAMAQDFSWDASARQYVKTYGRAIRRIAGRNRLAPTAA